MSELKRRHQRPEGVLIEEALARPPKMSIRALGRRVGLSEGRVRQIINGYQSMQGQVLEVTGPAETVARLAFAAGVDAEALESVGRRDAAEVLARLEAPDATPIRVARGLSVDQAVAVFGATMDLIPAERRSEALQNALTAIVPLVDADGQATRGNVVAVIPAEGGEEDGDSAPTTIGLVSDQDVDVQAAAKEGLIEEPGEFND